MSLPDAPIAQEGFFATHFFTVRDQEKSKDFYVRIFGGRVIKAEIPATSNWLMPGSFSIVAGAQLPTNQRFSSEHRWISTK
jgi:catechol 2,3-dioxygenase-like lactoylglutathione lyase family enzyme